jgi:3-oxoacyl-[acyl-carrier protein] reductase
MSFAGRVALVTGGGSGLGEAIAHRLAAEGAAVLVLDLRGEKAEAVAAAINAGGAGRAELFTADVADEARMEAAVAAARAAFGAAPDIAVCSAGITDRAPALEMPLEAFERVIRTNLVGAFVSARVAARAMVAEGRRRPAQIVTIGSVSGQLAGMGRVAYGASKGGVEMLTRVLAMERAPPTGRGRRRPS